jgi:hypothetical protein
MTWPLTPEEIEFPTLLPAVAMVYPSISSDVPTTVGMTWTNHIRSEDGGYAGPISPVNIPSQPAFGPIRAPRGARGEVSPPWGQVYDTDDFEASPPESFYPPVTRTYEDAMFMTTERVQPFLANRPNGSGVSGLGTAEWYETPHGALAAGVVAGTVAYFATRAFLKRRARMASNR